MAGVFALLSLGVVAVPGRAAGDATGAIGETGETGDAAVLALAASPRARRAVARRTPELRRSFVSRGAAWPPRGLLVRVCKAPRQVELWAAPRVGRRWRLVEVVPICAASGLLGPKGRRGDFQVPEGVYRVNRVNPWSRYHLSLGLDYPNAADRARAGDEPPGSDIFLHGGCLSAGCVAVGDEAAERLWVAVAYAVAGGAPAVGVRIYPCRFGEAACQAALEDVERARRAPQLWADLRRIYRRFERRRVPERVLITAAGYHLAPPLGRRASSTRRARGGSGLSRAHPAP